MDVSNGEGALPGAADHGDRIGADLTHAGWRKSSWSTYNGNCVEVAPLRGGLVGVRDSKDREGPVLIVDGAAWRSFLTQIRHGRLGG